MIADKWRGQIGSTFRMDGVVYTWLLASPDIFDEKADRFERLAAGNLEKAKMYRDAARDLRQINAESFNEVMREAA